MARYYLQKLKSFFFSKDILSFLLFLALSSAFWFVNTLGKLRETEISIPLTYVGIPPRVVLLDALPSQMGIVVEGRGLQLLNYSKMKIKPLTIDLTQKYSEKGKILVTPDQLREKISSYLLPSTSLLEIHPDTILVRYEKQGVVTLPVALNHRIELASQYLFSDRIKIEPAYITVYGPKQVLDTMESVPTELLVLKNLRDTGVYTCIIKPVKSLRYSFQHVNVKVFVEQYTEKKVQLPITAINCPPGLTIRTFPAFVEATYTVGLSHFSTFDPNNVQVYIDYNDLKDNKVSKQKLKIKTNVEHITNLRVSPQEVEFLLEAQ
ncbi:MAG TPA: hypothetical protein VK152_12140 [Paludibacter sp.]|nr:hypothetical protein [Paludibacter sp.]